MAHLQDKLIDNENNESNTDLIKNHIYSIAEEWGVRVEIQLDNQVFWFGNDTEIVDDCKEETITTLRVLHPELY